MDVTATAAKKLSPSDQTGKWCGCSRYVFNVSSIVFYKKLVSKNFKQILIKD